MKTKTIAWMTGCLAACMVACGGDDSNGIEIPKIPGSGSDSGSDSDPDQPPVFERYDLSVHTGWAELPTVDNDSEDLYYMAHFCSGLPGGRNYSICYSEGNRITYWSAFPLHECYKGDQSRSDAWAYDPDLPQSIQPNLVKGSYKPQPGYSKGHLLASGDRTVNATANIQTFYVTNAAPQWQNSFNSGVWSSLETDCWKNVCADTLYVVSGCHFADYDNETKDKAGNICPIPTSYFKVLLRTRSGQTGNRIADCTASELRSIGFWVANENGQTLGSNLCKSVEEIERLTGFTFFPEVDASVKRQCAPEEWGF